MADQELDLVAKVDLRLALADSEDQLQKALASYLPPLLLKLASSHGAVRQAVFKIIQNVFPRITAARTMRLPVDALLLQIQAPNVPNGADSGQVRLYSLLFLQKGIERLTPEERFLLIPKLLQGYHTYPPAVTSRVFAALLKCLDGYKAPARDSDEYEKCREQLGFDVRPEDERALVKTASKFFLLLPNANAPIQTPGMSVQDLAHFTKDAGVTYKSLGEIQEAKLRIMELLSAGFTESLLVLPLLIASADGSSSINNKAALWFKKLPLDLEDKYLIDSMTELFLGKSEPLTPPVSPTLQEKILALLCKSKCAMRDPRTRKISEHALNSEYSRLRQTAVAYIRTVTKSSSGASQEGAGLTQDDFNLSILSKLKDSIMKDGWPEMDTSQVLNYRQAVNLRMLQYEALGDILRYAPQLWEADLTYIKFLFDSLEEESIELRPVVQDVLSALEPHLSRLSSECKSELKKVLRKYLEFSNSSSNLSACCYVAMKYSNSAFAFLDAEARYLCFLGSAKSNNPETVEEANKGLQPYYFNLLKQSNNLDFRSSREFLGTDSSVRFPAFTDLVNVLQAGLSQADEESTLFQSLGVAVRFILRAFVMEVTEDHSTVIVVDEDWGARVDKALEVDETVQSLVIGGLAQEKNLQGVQSFLSICFDSLYNLHFGGSQYVSDTGFSTVLAQVISFAPSSAVSQLKSYLPKLLLLLDEKVLALTSAREVCKILGMIAANRAVLDNEVLELLSRLVDMSDTGNNASRITGRLLAQAYIISRLALVQRNDLLSSQTFKSYIQQLREGIKDSRSYDAVLESLSQLAIFGVLGPQLELYDDIKKDVRSFKEVIIPRAKKCHELSVLALLKLELSLAETYDSMQNDELTETEQIIYDTHTSKQLDYTLASGEAFAIVAGGWKSRILQQELDIQGVQVAHVPQSTGRLPVILKNVLEACANTKPSLRRAGCLWLLSLVQYLSGEKEIAENASRIHVAFMRFLADRDELVQELASRGLSIIYELGDADLKETLVKGLFRSFTDSETSTNPTAGTVDLETQLFDPNVLKTHDGSVSTYRDVLNLAQDVGDPGLVYKFMSLAKSNALWSSRRGMAFGLGSIMAKSSLDDMLSKNKNLSTRLIPKLYRYRFDPNVAVAKSMGDIWTALIKDTQKTIREYFDVILNEVLKGMGSKEWRVRQASTAALGNLLQTLPLELYEQRLEEIWNMSFRAMDDIKESVRKEGTQLCRLLAKTLSRLADVSTGNATVAKATEVLNYLIPFFLSSKGLHSDAKDVREFALETIVDLCKVGGKAVKPHVPELLETFIQLMSTLEPEIVNYLVLNAEKYNLRTSDVDAKRIQSLGHSPMINAIERLLALADEYLMPHLIVALQRSVKSSVGLPSKVCGSRVIVNLVSKKYAIVKPFGDKLLATCIQQLNDRNEAVASSYAAAAGYVSKIASMDAVLKYSETIARMYLEAEDEAKRRLAGIASESVSKYSGLDRFEAVASAFLPLVFVAKHDESEEVREIFEREWIESSSGNSAAKIYFDEIIKISETYGKLTNHYIRQVIARSLADFCQSIDIDSEKQLKALFDILLDFCKGKSWNGKELVFDALVTFTCNKSAFVRKNDELLNAIYHIVQVESKRRNKIYQVKAIQSVGKFVHEYPENDELVQNYIEVLILVLSEDYIEDLDLTEFTSISNFNKNQEKIIYEEFHLNLLKSIFQAVSPKIVHKDLLQLAFEELVKFKNSDHEKSWRTCTGFNENFKLLLEGLEKESTSLSVSELNMIAEAFTILFEFDEKGMLEKNIIMLSRNSKVLHNVFKENGDTNRVRFIVDNLTKLKRESISTITSNELQSAIDHFQ